MNKNKLKLSIAISLSALVVLWILLLSNSYSYSDNDLGWHLRIGADIVLSGRAPTMNLYNYTLEDQTWVDHEWFLNRVMFSSREFAGDFGLHLLFSLVILVAVYINWKRTRNVLGDTTCIRYGSLIILFAALWASSPHLGIRVQEFGLLMLTVLFFLFSLYPRQRHWFWLLPPLFLIWANIHGTFILGLGLFAVYIVYLWLLPLFRRWSWLGVTDLGEVSRDDKFTLMFIWFLSCLATLINPYGLSLYTFLSGYRDTFYMIRIQEWQGQASLPIFYPQIIYLSVAITMSVLYFLKRRLGQISLWEWGVSLFFLVLAFKSRRHFPLFAFASIPLLTLASRELLVGASFKASKRMKVIIGSTLIFLVLGLLGWKITNSSFNRSGIASYCQRKYPCQAVDYLKQHPELNGKRLFNEFNWGGYLLYAYPERKIFIDGRMPQAPLKGHSILAEYTSFRNDDTDLEAKLKEYDIKLALLYAHERPLVISPFERLILAVSEDELSRPDYLRIYLENSSDWQKIYEDQLSVIFEKKQ